MSGITSATGGYGLLNLLISNSNSVRQSLNTLTEQASNGLVGNTYAGLGSGASVALNLSPHVATLQVAQQNISAASGLMDVTSTAMDQMQQIAASFVAKIPSLNGLNPSVVDSVAANARDALQQVAGMLNTKDGSNYVFSGQDTANPPVPSGDGILSSGFYTQINAAVSALSTNGAAATAASTLSIAGSNTAGTSPFSTYLSQPASAIGVTVVDNGNGTKTQTGLIASANTAVASTGSSTTGSYMRDLMRALATLGSMTSAQTNDPGFSTLVQDTRDTLNSAVTAMAADAGVLGDRRASLNTLSASLSQTSIALSGQVSAVQDVDMAATLSKLTSTQSQLQASYKLITAENSMSLVNFLPA